MNVFEISRVVARQAAGRARTGTDVGPLPVKKLDFETVRNAIAAVGYSAPPTPTVVAMWSLPCSPQAIPPTPAIPQPIYLHLIPSSGPHAGTASLRASPGPCGAGACSRAVRLPRRFNMLTD